MLFLLGIVAEGYDVLREAGAGNAAAAEPPAIKVISGSQRHLKDRRLLPNTDCTRTEKKENNFLIAILFSYHSLYFLSSLLSYTSDANWECACS